MSDITVGGCVQLQGEPQKKLNGVKAAVGAPEIVKLRADLAAAQAARQEAEARAARLREALEAIEDEAAKHTEQDAQMNRASMVAIATMARMALADTAPPTEAQDAE